MRPPIFDRCTSVISQSDERVARDAYWRVVSSEATLTDDEALSELLRATRLNPFIGEPDFLIAQIHFRTGRFRQSAQHCAYSLEKMYALGTAWDKRRSYGAWVGHARLLALRANRRLSGSSTSLPTETRMPKTAAGLPLVSVRELVKLMRELEDSDFDSESGRSSTPMLPYPNVHGPGRAGPGSVARADLALDGRCGTSAPAASQCQWHAPACHWH